MSLNRFQIFISLDTNSKDPLLRIVRTLKHIFSLNFKTAFALLHRIDQSKNMQVVAPLIRHDDQRHLSHELQEKVAAVFPHSEHLHHVEVVEVHLVLDVQTQNLFQVLVMSRIQN